MKPRALVAVALATAFALVGAACSKDVVSPSGPPEGTTSASADASRTPDPCQLMTAADLESTTGVTFHQLPDLGTTTPDPPGYRICNYEETNDTDGLPAAAWVALYPTERAEFDTGRDALMQLPLDLADIEGVGETAYGNANEIRIFQARWYVEIQVKFVDLDGTDAIRTLAGTVLSRLP